jgi:hypothetical protein
LARISIEEPASVLATCVWIAVERSDNVGLADFGIAVICALVFGASCGAIVPDKTAFVGTPCIGMLDEVGGIVVCVPLPSGVVVGKEVFATAFVTDALAPDTKNRTEPPELAGRAELSVGTSSPIDVRDDSVLPSESCGPKDEKSGGEAGA